MFVSPIRNTEWLKQFNGNIIWQKQIQSSGRNLDCRVRGLGFDSRVGRSIAGLFSVIRKFLSSITESGIVSNTRWPSGCRCDCRVRGLGFHSWIRRSNTGLFSVFRFLSGSTEPANTPGIR
ncbi:hypothetical protein SFRURICE_001285, partial [Spodoptera frugiperda]